MRIVKDYPPNYNEIQSALNPDNTMIFCFGDTVYNPTGKEIPEDILFHESIHVRQQSQFAYPELWWNKYLHSKSFRISQEVEAYYEQWQWVRKHYPLKASEECLTELASNLAKLYNVGISPSQAQTIIRKFRK